MYEIILASQSPRRRQLLEEAGYKFQVHPVKVSENIEENLNPPDYATTLSRRKAEAWLADAKTLNLKGKIVLSADTIVAYQKRILGKPENFQQAREFLELLSGNTHSVVTAFTLVADGLWSRQYTGFEETKVNFKKLTSRQIEDYIASGEPMDKAGAYGIQGQAKEFVENYEGSWSNVVGLPLEALEKALQENCWNVDQRKS